MSWISVKDRLPEEFVSVLVHMPGEAPLPTVHEGFLGDEGIWCVRGYRCDSDEVDKWAEMPEPPKEKDHE